jgi:hypothetical protein
MNTYDPDVSPASADWLRTDAGDRIQLVVADHGRKAIKLPDSRLHAVVHVVVENQLALGEQVVVNTLARLQAEGLSRHDALHAIGSILAENLYELMHDEQAETEGPYRRYLERLQKLTASSWRSGNAI